MKSKKRSAGKSRKKRSPTVERPTANPVTGVTSLRRYRKVLMKVLTTSCSNYSWAPYLSLLLRNKEWGDLYSWAECASTEVYGTAAEHYAANQIVALVKKYPWHWTEIGLNQSPKDAAIETFLKAEKRCGVTNKRFATLGNRFTSYKPQLEYMRRWIFNLLGETPDLKDIYQQCGFSSGAAIGVHGNATNLYRKLYAKDWSVSSCAKIYAMHALWSNDQIPLLFAEKRNGFVCYDRDEIIKGMQDKCVEKSFNYVSFVPKTAKTHRSIAVEPLLNSYIQKGIDAVLRRKLRRRGYDLSDQTRNQTLAREGSVTGLLATMDLSSASDTISIGLARYLLPWEWFDLLNRTRSASYSIDGKEPVRYNKFASMGNGFCFPLETIIFTAATRASIHFSRVADKTHSIYGDDIIVPTGAYETLSKLLNYCGFVVNSSKSFNTGPFRESCGADWYEGQDVRPVYLDYLLADDIRLMIFHNATLRGSWQSLFFEEVLPMIRAWVPYRQRMCRPLSAQPLQPLDPRFSAGGFRHLQIADPRVKDALLSWDEFLAQAISNGAFSVDQDTFMASHKVKWDRSIWNWTWQELLVTPVEDKPGKDPIHKSNFNTSRYLSLLLGSPGGKLNLRRKVRLGFKQ